MGAIGPNTGAIFHGDAAHGEERLLVALAKGLQGLERGDRRDGELGEAHDRRDLAARLELLGRQRVEHRLEPVAELVKARGLAGHAHGARVAAKADEQVGALLDGAEQVHRANRATGPPCDAVPDGEEDRGHVVAVHYAARHDALDALVPALATNDYDAPAVPGGRDLRERLLGEERLRLAALPVDVLKLPRKDRRLGGVVGHEHVDGHVGGAHASGGVEARDDREGQRVRRDLGDVLTGAGRKGHQAGTRGAPQPPYAIGDQGAVLGRELHHVREGAQGGDVGVGAPDVRPPQALAQHRQQLERHARARKVSGGAVCRKLGVRHGNAARHEVRRLVVVGHHHVYPLLAKPADLVLGGNAVVDGHDEVRLAVCQHAVERRLGEAIALAKAVRDVGAGVSAQLTQAKCENAGGAHAIDVKVTKDGDALPRPHGPLDAIRRLGHARNGKGVCPVALEGGREEGARLIDTGDAPGHKDPRHKPGDAQGGSERRLGARVRAEDVPTSAVEKAGHASLPLARSSRRRPRRERPRP